jgi:acetylornithine deacetylase/succinyl-diaminopimelate desuccinylase-like protein
MKAKSLLALACGIETGNGRATMFDPAEKIKELVRQPSVSTDPAFAEGMQGAREVLESLFGDMGLAVETVSTPRHPVILARREGPAEWPHVLIYGHYDVQPPDPLDLWETPAFEPTMKGKRLYGRGAADNKGPMMAHIAAVARLLEEDPSLPLRITFLIEGEEEIGSPSLPAVLESHKESLTGDFVLLSDTLNPTADQVAIPTGLRGMVTLEFTLTGPKSDIHSGLFGGAVFNPIQAMAELCASLHDADGRINVPGFYDGILQPADWEADEIAKLPTGDPEMAAFTGVPALRPVTGRTGMEATRLEPTLEFNGIYGGYTGEGDKTIVPSTATVKISCRLIANQKPERIEQLLMQTLQDRCPPEIRIAFKKGHSGVPYSVVPPGRPNTPADQNPHLAKAFAVCHAAVTESYGKPPLYLREGGSIPIIGEIRNVLGMDSLMLGLGTAENNLHAPNESFDLDALEKTIAISQSILKAVAKS